MKRLIKWMRSLLAPLVAVGGLLSLSSAFAQQFSSRPQEAAPSEYRIEKGDTLELKFFYSPELNDKVTVRPDGAVALQLIGDVELAGLTPSAASKLLSQRYAAELADPVVDVLVRSFARQRVFVDGQVGHPGVVDLTGPLTVSQAIASGGGLLPSARSGSVLVIRRQQPNGPPQVITVDMKKILQRRPSAEDIPLQASDIVYVANSRIGNVNRFVDLYLRKNIPVYLGLSWAPF